MWGGGERTDGVFGEKVEEREGDAASPAESFQAFMRGSEHNITAYWGGGRCVRQNAFRAKSDFTSR